MLTRKIQGRVSQSAWERVLVVTLLLAISQNNVFQYYPRVPLVAYFTRERIRTYCRNWRSCTFERGSEVDATHLLLTSEGFRNKVFKPKIFTYRWKQELKWTPTLCSTAVVSYVPSFRRNKEILVSFRDWTDHRYNLPHRAIGNAIVWKVDAFHLSHCTGAKDTISNDSEFNAGYRVPTVLYPRARLQCNTAQPTHRPKKKGGRKDWYSRRRNDWPKWTTTENKQHETMITTRSKWEWIKH